MAVTDAQFDALEDKVDELESLVVTSDQVSALAKLYDADTQSLQTQLEEILDRVKTLESRITSFYQWRADVRNDVRLEDATNPSGNTWKVPTAYDKDAPIIVYDGIVRVLDSNITLSDPDAGEFESAISLSGPVTVFYFRAFPTG